MSAEKTLITNRFPILSGKTIQVSFTLSLFIIFIYEF
jgi:hypothetical protein